MYYCFKIISYLVPPPTPPPIHKMLLESYEEDIKQLSSGALTIKVIFLIYAGIT